MPFSMAFQCPFPVVHHSFSLSCAAIERFVGDRLLLHQATSREQWETPKPGWSQRGAAVNLPGHHTRPSRVWDVLGMGI